MKYQILLPALITGLLILPGCGSGKEAAEEPSAAWETAGVSDAAKEDEAEDISEADEHKPEAPEEQDKDETDHPDTGDGPENNAASDEPVDREAMKQAYIEALDTFLDKHILPDGSDVTEDMEALDEDFSGNKFAVYDVDGDGVEELVISFTTTYSAAMVECAYGYDGSTGELYEELAVFPSTQYYTFGFLKEMDSHNQGVSGDFWPYTLHKYDPVKKEYEAVAYIEAWDGNNFPKDMNGKKFPAEYDKDGDGMLYYMRECSGDYKQINKEPYDYQEFSDWLREEMCDRSAGYAQIASSVTPTWQYFTTKALKAYKDSDSIVTACDDDFFTEFKVRDMTFYMSNDFMDKVYVVDNKKFEDSAGDGYTFYHRKSADAYKEMYPDEDYTGGYLFSIEALDDDYEVDYSYSFDYYGSSPSKDGKTEYYNYVAFTPTDWPAMGGPESIDEYRDLQYQYENIHEEIKDCVRFPYLPNYKDFEEDYELDHGHSFWDDYDRSQEKDGQGSSKEKESDKEKSRKSDKFIKKDNSSGSDKDSGQEKGTEINKKTRPGRSLLRQKQSGDLDPDMAAAYDGIAAKKEYSYDNEMGTFALQDLNADGIPELIIDPDGLIVSENLYYTYENGKAVELDASKMDIPVWGSLLVSSGSGTFCFYRGGPAADDDNGRFMMPHMYIVYSINKGRIREGDSYYGINYEDDNSWKCSKNGKDCSYSEFERFVRSMDGSVEFVDNTAANRHTKGLE